MEYQEHLRQKYEVEDPWHFGTRPFEKTRHAAMTEFVLAKAPRKVLDLGCGEGHFLAYLLNRAPRLAIIGVELEPAAAARCAARLAAYPDVNIITQDILDFLATGTDESYGAYDAVVCGDALYYLTPEAVTQRVVPTVAALLRPAGGLVLSYADVNEHQWTVDVFRQWFMIEKQVYIKPMQEPPPWPWMVSLLTLGG